MKRFKNAVMLNYKNKPIKLPLVDTGLPGEITLEMAIRAMKSIYPYSSIDQDSQNGRYLEEQLDKCKGKPFLEIEDSQWDWLINVVNTAAPRIFRDDAIDVLKLIKEGFLKEEDNSKLKISKGVPHD